jgi:hypothetical protein
VKDFEFSPVLEQAKKGFTPSQLRGLLKALRKLPDRAQRITETVGREDPRDFVRDVLGEKPTAAALAAGYTEPWTPDQEKILVSVKDNQKTVVPAGHGTGKSYIAARIALWWLYRKPDTKVVTTAPTKRQVQEVLWGEIHKAMAASKTPLPGEHTLTEIKVAPGWIAIGISTKPGVGDISATTFQGLHAANVLVIYDEATGVDPLIRQGGDSIALRPTDRQLAIGNPTDPSSWFKAACDTWDSVIRMSCENHPNVLHNNPEIVPGAVTREWIKDRLEEYGSRDAPLFQCKALGLFPTQSSDALIQVAWVERSQRHETEEKDDGKGTVLGLDIAAEGEDLTVLWACKNRRFFVPEIRGKRAWHVGKDVMQAVTLARHAIDELPNVRAIALDDTSIGSAVRARLLEIQRLGGLPQYRAGTLKQMAIGRNVQVIPVNFGQPAWDRDRFDLKVDELWWRMRESLEADEVYLPSDEELALYGFPRTHSLVAQLTRCMYAFPTAGRIEVYDKRGRHGERALEKTKHLPTQSPDIAHALILCNYARNAVSTTPKADPLFTTQDYFDRATREAIERSHPKNLRSERRRPPWVRIGRSRRR